MKKIIGMVLMISMTAVLAAGCQLENTASGTPEADGTALSGSAAAEDAPASALEEGDDGIWNANSDNLYRLDDDGDNALFQYRLDGSRKNKIKLDTDEVDALEWVTDQWLYYKTINRKSEDVLWRIPVKKTGNGDRLQPGKKEKIFATESELSVAYATDEYLILLDDGIDEENSILWRYDLTDQSTRQITKGGYIEVFDTEDYPLLMQGDMIFESADYETTITKLFCLDPETGKKHCIGSYDCGGEDWGCSDWISMGDSLWILAGNTLYEYSRSTDELNCVIDKKCFRKAVKELKKGKDVSWSVDEIYAENGRLYFPGWIEWIAKDREEASSGMESEYTKWELFSAPIRDLKHIRYESGIMKSLEEHVKGAYEKYRDKSGQFFNMYCYSGYFEDFQDGKIYYSYDKGDTTRYIIYDIQTGEKKERTNWKKLTEEEQEIFDI